jgi:hypothetical protein
MSCSCIPKPVNGSAETAGTHPCFDAESPHRYARIPLPIAPTCNMQRNYCNRGFSCGNESRPGITCAVLSPQQALGYLRDYSARVDNLGVVGIAGPGDSFANSAETLETLRLVKAGFPRLKLCVAAARRPYGKLVRHNDDATLPRLVERIRHHAVATKAPPSHVDLERFRAELSTGPAGGRILALTTRPQAKYAFHVTVDCGRAAAARRPRYFYRGDIGRSRVYSPLLKDLRSQGVVIFAINHEVLARTYRFGRAACLREGREAAVDFASMSDGVLWSYIYGEPLVGGRLAAEPGGFHATREVSSSEPCAECFEIAAS